MTQPDLLSLADLEAAFIERLAERACNLSRHWRERTMPRSLCNAGVGSIAELPGWRNPTALALGVEAMGGSCVTVTAKLEGAETVEDLAGYLDNWFDLLAVRTPSLSRLRAFAQALDAPTVNLRTNDNHPCEVLGDLAFVLERRCSWESLRVAMVGPAANIARSWAEAAVVLPIEVTHVRPGSIGFVSSDVGVALAATDDPNAITDADLIVTDCWPNDPTEVERQHLAELRIDAAPLDRCRPDVLFVPCPPVTRGQEATDEAMRHPQCVARPAKAFLEHVQNAFIEHVLT